MEVFKIKFKDADKISEEAFENWKQYGRIRRLAKKVDPYACTFENNGEMRIALSTGQTIGADKLVHLSDLGASSYINLIFAIGRSAAE